MLGAIAGDVIGSVYEGTGSKATDFPLLGSSSTFTDDSVLTAATADVLLTRGDYAEAYRRWFRRHPGRGFGAGFAAWASSDGAPAYGSFGNGSAMRVSPVGWLRDTPEDVLDEAERSAAVTHDHPEGVKGAQATALAVYLARTGAPGEAIRTEIARRFGYDLDRRVDELRPAYRFDVTCQGSVPEALLCFLEAGDFETSVRNAVSLGGDADTQACIAGAVAEAAFGVPAALGREIETRLAPDLRSMLFAFRCAVAAGDG